MIKTVVIGLDHSDLSTRALPFAREVAENWRGRLVLVHAHDERDRDAPRPPDVELGGLVNDLNHMGIPTDAVIRRGPPAQTIVDVADERGADLIVMASHQRRGFDRWLHGSVTEEVLTGSTTPLLVIPSESTPFPRSIMRVFVPVDGTHVGEAPLDFLRGRSAARAIELLLVQVVSVGPVIVGLDPSFTVTPVAPVDLDDEIREAREYMTRLAHGFDDSGVTVHRQVIEAADAITEVIFDTARREQVDLIAVGTHAKAGISRLVLGSISEQILERSQLPVLLVHPKAESSAETGRAVVDERAAAHV